MQKPIPNLTSSITDDSNALIGSVKDKLSLIRVSVSGDFLSSYLPLSSLISYQSVSLWGFLILLSSLIFSYLLSECQSLGISNPHSIFTSSRCLLHRISNCNMFISLTHNGSQVRFGDKYDEAIFSCIIIFMSKVAVEDAGNYTCQVNTDAITFQRFLYFIFFV